MASELTEVENLKLTPGDVYRQLLSPPTETFDLIVIDVDHSPSDQLGEEEHEFYTPKGLEMAKSHLAAGGVLAVWSYAESSNFADALKKTFGTVHVEEVRTFNSLVNHEQTDWLFFGVN